MPYHFYRNLIPKEILALTEELISSLSLFGPHETSEEFSKHGGLREGLTLWIQHNDHSGFEDLGIPNTYEVLRTLASEIKPNPKFGRVYIHKLPPGKVIHSHIDNFPYHDKIDRYHVYLDIPERVLIHHNGKEILPYSVIQFDHKSEHMYVNNSEESLYFMVFDLYKD